jgi:hypothetical protein
MLCGLYIEIIVIHSNGEGEIVQIIKNNGCNKNLELFMPCSIPKSD